jgi:hypothetical protein
LAVAVRQECNELAVARQRSGLFLSLEVGESLESGAGNWISPKIFFAVKPQAYANCQCDCRRCPRKYKPPLR